MDRHSQASHAAVHPSSEHKLTALPPLPDVLLRRAISFLLHLRDLKLLSQRGTAKVGCTLGETHIRAGKHHHVLQPSPLQHLEVLCPNQEHEGRLLSATEG